MSQLTPAWRGHQTRYGIMLPSEQEKLITSKFELFKERTPAQAKSVLKLRRFGKSILGTLQVKSPELELKAKATGDNSLEVFERLELKIEQQLLAWRKSRFKSQESQRLNQ